MLTPFKKAAHEAITDIKAKMAFGEPTEATVLAELAEKTRDVVGLYLDKKVRQSTSGFETSRMGMA